MAGRAVGSELILDQGRVDASPIYESICTPMSIITFMDRGLTTKILTH